MLIITDFINKRFLPLDFSETVADVSLFLKQNYFSHFPVEENGVYLGNISLEAIEEFDESQKLKDCHFDLEHFFVKNTTIWTDIFEIFSKNETNIIPVLDQNDTFLGCYELIDLIHFVTDMPFLKEFGNTIIVEKPILDYTMGQVIQIVESNNGKIFGAVVSNLTIDRVQITIKIAMENLNEIIQTFRRYDYTIISEHQDDHYLKDLKERVDYLEHYLNV